MRPVRNPLDLSMGRFKKVIPHHQLVIIHAELPGVDWGGLLEHIESTRGEIPFRSCVAVKTFFDMVDHRRDWPSPQQRQCTSDLKRGPIERTIRHLIKELGHSGLIVNCVGIRAQESSRRAKANPWQYSERNSKNGREWYEWLPIFEMTLTQRSQVIAAAGQKPHWAYLAGMTRLSCQICIMSSKHDLMTAARLSPELYAKYVAKEKELDRTIMMPPKKGPRLFLEDITGIRADPKYLPNAQGYQQAV